MPAKQKLDTLRSTVATLASLIANAPSDAPDQARLDLIVSLCVAAVENCDEPLVSTKFALLMQRAWSMFSIDGHAQCGKDSKPTFEFVRLAAEMTLDEMGKHLDAIEAEASNASEPPARRTGAGT
ncbi:MAG: hypothetical protein QOD26_2641 [Betaproteobacteria bacterium]|jgi:hypothetical protein|nr:hypothetical protein [Betaproteobacteria bacterium]